VDYTAPFRCFRALPRLRAAILAFLITILLSSTASAVIYMKVQDINGDVTAEGYSGWIEVTSLQWSLGRAISAPTGGAGDRESSSPSFSEVATTKVADKTTVALFKEAAIGEAKTVEFHFLRTDRDKLVAYQKIKLEGVLISAFSQSS
jgi:type VI secretion system secreted protein Hcp